ncbi:hypothetical protein CCACVL1_00373 [Corchorus capsularis]|uniref:Uncharacterized protein n=1 Tax=Corchorus capsularis TaxID=210143 RepID=A0A1R3KXA3_COCAP|nr:hypothetical protein CCACVL1_00373 [Corchorus capsularis]
MTKFSKLITKTAVEKSLLIPTCYFNGLHLEEGEGQFFHVNVIDDQTGKNWTFPCFIQQNEGLESSDLSIGWLRFVRDKDVRVGDMIFLYQKSFDDNMKIEVKRKIRLLGQDIWAPLV